MVVDEGKEQGNRKEWVRTSGVWMLSPYLLSPNTRFFYIYCRCNVFFTVYPFCTFLSDIFSPFYSVYFLGERRRRHTRCEFQLPVFEQPGSLPAVPHRNNGARFCLIKESKYSSSKKELITEHPTRNWAMGGRETDNNTKPSPLSLLMGTSARHYLKQNRRLRIYCDMLPLNPSHWHVLPVSAPSLRFHIVSGFWWWL